MNAVDFYHANATNIVNVPRVDHPENPSGIAGVRRVTEARFFATDAPVMSLFDACQFAEAYASSGLASNAELEAICKIICESHIDTTIADHNINDPCPLCAASSRVQEERDAAFEEAAQLLEEMRKFPVEPCSHDMEGDEDICDGCHFAWEKKQATVAAAIRAKKKHSTAEAADAPRPVMPLHDQVNAPKVTSKEFITNAWCCPQCLKNPCECADAPEAAK